MTTGRFLRRGEVESIVGLSTAAIYDRIAKGTFPKPINVGSKAVRWLEDDVRAWQEQCIAEARSKVA